MVLEVSPLASGEPPAELLVAAYRASVTGPVALVLTDTDAATVDPCLDEEVARDRRVYGVRYLTWSDRHLIASAVLHAPIVEGASAPFRALLQELGRRVPSNAFRVSPYMREANRNFDPLLPFLNRVRVR